MAFPTGWTSYSIASDSTKVSGTSDLTGYVALIKDVGDANNALSDAVYAGLLSTGADLRITTDSAGTTQIPFEIVSIDTTAKTCQIWLRIPTLAHATNTPITIWYGNASAVAYAATDTYGSQAVWSDYSVVYHKESNGADSTASGYTSSETNVTHAASAIGNGSVYGSTSSDDISGANLDVGTGAFTMQVFANPDDFSGSHYLWSLRDGQTLNEIYIQITTGLLNWALRDSGAAVINDVFTSNATSIGANNLVYCARSGATMDLWLNGTNSQETTGPTADVGSAVTHKIGRGWNDSGDMVGKMDEFRLRKSFLSTDWRATEYNNYTSPSTFWTSGTIYSVEVADSLGLTDTVNYDLLKTISASISDSLGLTDNIDYQTLLVLNRSISDTLGITDLTAYDLMRVYSVAIADIIGMTDNIDYDIEKAPVVTILPKFRAIIDDKPKMQNIYRRQEQA